ncbi:MAG TPA: chemotaxis protein CheB [Stellaceae bacterium]|nr:chemotaxis protein CheB [Stellaceae bacterium]
MFLVEHMESSAPQAGAEAATPALAYSAVVIGASAGGISALMTVLEGLPANFALPILVVQHIAAEKASQLPAVLGWRTRLAVKWAEDGEIAEAGTVYIAPPDQHLLLQAGGRLVLSSADRVDFWRPAIDVLFESAVDTYGSGVAAVILSGMMWDGAKGIAAVAKGGGITIVQDEATSRYFEMPTAALDFGHADLMMSPPRIAQALGVLAEVVA